MKQRIIKFRAWDTGDKDMIGDNDFYQNADELPNGRRTGCHLSDFFIQNEDGAIGKEREKIIWMQFTGLLDKNGKEIYEGDIITFVGGNSIHTVGENSDIRVVEVQEDTKQLGWKGSGYTFCETNCKKLVEIIGNIYENSDLIK